MIAYLLVAATIVEQPATDADKADAPEAAWVVPPDFELPTPLPADQALAEFRKAVESGGRYPADAARFILDHQQAAEQPPDSAPSLDDYLALISPEFKAGLDASAAGQFESAAERFSEPARADDPWLAVNASFFAVQALLERQRVREARDLLAGMFQRHARVERYTTHTAELLFLLGYTQAHTLQYEAAARTLGHFLEHAAASPERLQTSARQMLTELQRREPGKLPDVVDLMSYSGRELSLGQTDDDVVRRQDDAVQLLDRLIQDAEQNEQSGGGKSGGGKQRAGRQSRPRNQRGGATSPRPRSTLESGGAAEKQLEKARRARPEEFWGRLPPREREQILQSLHKQFPSQYRELVEQYYRELARESPAR